jgi:hypothetical protein
MVGAPNRLPQAKNEFVLSRADGKQLTDARVVPIGATRFGGNAGDRLLGGVMSAEEDGRERDNDTSPNKKDVFHRRVDVPPL